MEHVFVVSTNSGGGTQDHDQVRPGAQHPHSHAESCSLCLSADLHAVASASRLLQTLLAHQFLAAVVHMHTLCQCLDL